METEKEFYTDIQKNILVPILNSIAARRGELAELSRKLEKDFGMKHAKIRLSELRSGSRVLSFYFLKIMVNGGLMGIDQILRGRKIDDLTPIEKDIVLRLIADPEIIQLIYEATKEGFDVKQLLKISLKKT